ncbi:MAG: polysaccharide deacetylase family protein [Candidatus Paceibacterota bacterium]|jgi:peptidoglycan/xylan/chitin deacetylase (PgdA/CDA1 family)
MTPILVDDDVFATESPTDGRLFYDFNRYKEVHELLASAGLKHCLAICAAEIPNHTELLEYIQSRQEEFIFGLHGWNHEKYSTWPKEAIIRSLGRAKDRIEKVFGVKVEWYFPTWNKRSDEMYQACEYLGLKLDDHWCNLTEALHGVEKTTIRFHSWDDNEFKQLRDYVQLECWTI